MGTDADIDMADLASLDGPTSSAPAAAPSTRFAPKGKGKPKAKPKPKPKPTPEPQPEPIQEDAPRPAVAAVPEDGVDAMETDGAGASVGAMETDGAGASVGADEMDHEDEDFVLREIDVYFTPKPFDEDTMVSVPRSLTPFLFLVP
jgi:DNA-directed RNA polymerase-3 subunit RPC5